MSHAEACREAKRLATMAGRWYVVVLPDGKFYPRKTQTASWEVPVHVFEPDGKQYPCYGHWI